MLYAIYKYPENGRDLDKKLNKKYLTLGQKYQVSYVDMSQSSTSIILENIDMCFNSVNFDFEEDGKPIDIYSDPRYNPYLPEQRGDK